MGTTMNKIQSIDRATWLNERKRGLGGSDIAPILGVSPWRNEWDIYLSKTTQAKVEETEAPWLTRGRYLEPSIGKWYADTLGVTIESGSEHDIFVGPEDWMLGSPDAIVVSPERYGLEIKSSRSSQGWGDSGTDQVPVDYQLQSMWYAMVLDLPRWDVAVFLTMQDEFRWYTLHRDLEVEKHVVDTCREWWNKRVVGGEPPPIDGSGAATEWLRQKFANQTEPARQAFPDEVRLATNLKELQDQIRMLKLKESEFKNKLIASVGESEGVQWDQGKATYKEETRTTIDGKRLRKEKPELAEEYSKVKSIRVLRTSIKNDTPF
jgi:putative phage-type endonuclease